MLTVQANPVSLWPLIQRLQGIFHAQGREVRMRLPGAVRSGQPVSMEHWTQPMVEAIRPLMLPYWRSGLLQGQREVGAVLEGQSVQAVKSLSRMRRKRLEFHFLQANPRTFSLINPSVIQAIDRATLLFCQSTNDTATTGLGEAIELLREQLKQGVQSGEAHVDIARRVQSLFDDPGRANTIAVTETARATNGGSVIAYQQSGACEGSAWSTTTDPCPFCQELDGEERPFGEPFAVKKGGGPYAVIYHAPAHPFLLLR